MEPGSDPRNADADTDAIRRVLVRHPIRTGVLFGSQVRARSHPSSDVDVAVEFDPSVPDDERRSARLDVIVDLSRTLGVDDVDVIDLETVRPAIGASALEHGIVIAGDEAHVERMHAEFARRTTDETHADRMDRFDDALDSLEEKV